MTLDISKRAQKGVSGSVMAPSFWCAAAEQKRGSTEDVGHFKACTKGSEWECNGPIELVQSCRVKEGQHRGRWTLQSARIRD